MLLYMYISPRAGADNPMGTNAYVNWKPLLLCPFVAHFKTISTRFFMFLHMYIAPGRGRQTPGSKFKCQQKGLIILKKSLWVLILYTFLMFFHTYIALGQGQTTPWGQNFDPNRKALSLWPFVANFKKSLSTPILYIQATPAMSTSRISILPLMSKWFFIPYIFSLYFFAFQLRLCRKRLTWSNEYLEVIFHAVDIFSIIFATVYVKVKVGARMGTILSASAMYMY